MITNRILLQANPNFFGLSDKEQEAYRANFFKDDSNLLIFDTVIGNKHFGGIVTPEMHQAFSDDDYLIYNAYRTEIQGIGENRVWINEVLNRGNPALELETVLDYDLYVLSHCTDDTKMDKDAYNAFMQPSWSRYLEGGKLRYASGYSLAQIILERMELEGRGLIKELYPYRFVRAKEGEDSLMGFRCDAGDNTDKLNELKRRFRSHTRMLRMTLPTECERKNLNKTWFIEDVGINQNLDENHVTFVVPNQKMAGKIRWRTLLQDLRATQGNNADIDEIAAPYIKQACQFVRESYEDIELNFVPGKIVPIKRASVRFSSKAKEQLLDMLKKEERNR